METVPFWFACAGLLAFLVSVTLRTMMWLRMPIHVRWELYPVAHEGKRASYGGSYLEESEWWKKPREFSIWGEIRVMVPEILFLVALREHNRKLWYRSFPFHFGLYLITAGTVLMGGFALMGSQWESAEGFAGVLRMGIIVFGLAGLVLGLLGAAGLLHRRMTAPELKDFSAPADLFNLAVFVAVFSVALIGIVLLGVVEFFASLTGLIGQIVKLPFGHAEAQVPGIVGLSVVLMSLLLAYIPLTHMSHFIGKYFAYHSVRWNDAPNLKGSKQEKVIQEALGQPVSWSASHIAGDGKKNWVDVATTMPGEIKDR